MGTSYRVPLAGRGRLFMPAGFRARGGIWPGSSCTAPGLIADWLLGTTTRLGLSLTSPTAGFSLPDLDWDEWGSRWLPAGASGPELWTIGVPRDLRRQRFHLFVPDRRRRVLAFAKFTKNPHSELNIEVRQILTGTGFVTFKTPEPLAHGSFADWNFTIDRALDPGLHRPARLSPSKRSAIVAEIQAALSELASPGSVILHGDFGPWNVRLDSSGDTVVLDWEDVATGPTAGDELWHALNTVLIEGKTHSTAADRVRRQLGHHKAGAIADAARYWQDRLSGPEPAEVDSTTSGMVLGGLAQGQRGVLTLLGQR